MTGDKPSEYNHESLETILKSQSIEDWQKEAVIDIFEKKNGCFEEAYHRALLLRNPGFCRHLDLVATVINSRDAHADNDRKYLAGNPAMTAHKDSFKKLLNSKNPAIREACASNKSLHNSNSELLNSLLFDVDICVRVAATKIISGSTDLTLIKTVLADSELIVRKSLAQHIVALESSPLLKLVLETEDIEFINYTARHSKEIFNSKELYRSLVSNKNPLIRQSLVDNPNLINHPDLIIELSNDNSTSVRKKIAGLPVVFKIPPLLDKLIGDFDFIRCALALNPEMINNPDIIKVLSEDECADVRKMLDQNLARKNTTRSSRLFLPKLPPMSFKSMVKCDYLESH